MPKGHRKRTQEDYEREIKEAAQRMRKHPEFLKSARNNQTWLDFLVNVVGVQPQATESDSAQKFWNDVREQIYTRPTRRRNIYKEAREAGMPAKLARRIRDWSPERAETAIENWQARY